MSAHDWLLVALAITLPILLVGCGNEALRANATVARAMLEIQAESGPIVRELRVSASVNAAREVHDSGGDEATAQAAATETSRRWQCAIDGHRIYALAVGSYIDALALWLSGEDFELLDAIPFLRRGLDSYRVLSSCLRSLGSDALPEVPSFLNLIPPTWSVDQ